MRLSTGLLGLLFLVAPAVRSQGVPDDPKSQPSSQAVTSTAAQQTSTPSPSSTPPPTSTPPPESSAATSAATSGAPPAAETGPTSIHSYEDAPTIAGYAVPSMKIPDTAGAQYMHKSSLPEGTVFICVGAALGFFAASIFLWRVLVAWSLHRSVKRATQSHSVTDLKTMPAGPGKKRMYSVVGASSNMSLDRLSAAPPGTSRAQRPFASNPNSSTPPLPTSSLFFSPTAGGATGVRDSVANRSSSYLPAGYYAAGNAQPASGSPVMHVGGQAPQLSSHSLATPGNRFSTRSGISPPLSPSLPPSRGYDRAPPSRDGLSMYNRNSVATLGGQRGVYGHEYGNVSQLSLNVPGGTSQPGGRAPSAYLEDMFDNHGNGPKERF